MISQVQPDDEMDGPLLGGPGGRLAGGLAGRRLRRQPRDMQLELKMDGHFACFGPKFAVSRCFKCDPKQNHGFKWVYRSVPFLPKMDFRLS